MSKGLPQLLIRADTSASVTFAYDEIIQWPERELDRCLAAGLLHPAEPAQTLICDECGESEDVVLMDSIVSPPLVAYGTASFPGL